MTVPDVGSRLAKVRGAILEAREAAHVSRDVTLVAVSKRHSTDAIRAAYAAGQRDFGESYAQELREKATALADLPELRWHFVGGIQRNKVKLLSEVHLVHTIDRAATANALMKRRRGDAGSQTAVADVLVQVNFDEPQKAGVVRGELDVLFEQLCSVAGLRLRGLMTIPPKSTPSDSRRYFGELASLADTLRTRHGLGHEFNQLSMGMSGDFVDAIAEGATLVRVGTAIFGPRPTVLKT